MARRKPTMDDVARRANVAVGTVSNVLGGQVKVSDQRRGRVLRAIAALNYEPNVHAQRLRRRRSNVVGLCFPHVSTAYLNALSETLEDIAARNGYSVLHVFSRHEPATELVRVKELIKHGVDGLFLFPSAAPARTLDLAHRSRLPVVMVDRPTDDDRFDHVVVDNRKAMRKTAEHLIALGHTRLLFVSRSRTRLVTRHRREGLMAARRNATAAIDVRSIEYGDDEANVAIELTAFMRGTLPPTAIIASNSHQASLVLTTLRALGLRCPGDVSVVAFDDPDWAMLVDAPLSVIRQPAATIAQTAWELMMRRLRSRASPVHNVLLEAEIDFRASVGAPPRAARPARGSKLAA
jgi:LacI family transcriptional regulator